MEDLKKIQEFFSKPLNENKVTKEDFDKVVKILSKSKYPFTIMLVPKWNEIDIITGQDSPDEISDDISQRLDSAGLNWGGNSGITISGDSSNYSRREYSDIFKVNGGHKDYYEESVNEMDMNDPILMKMRAAKDKLAKMRAANAGDDGNDKFFDNAKKIAFLKKERERLMRDMEQEAEPEGGPIADEYGSKLNRIDAAIAKLSGRKEMTYDQAIAEDKSLKKGDIVKFKDGSSIYILGPKGDGYDYKDGQEKGHHPKGWFDMMISSGKAVVAEMKVGDKVTFKSGGGDMEIIDVRDMFASDLKAYRVKNADGETFEYSEDQLQLAEGESKMPTQDQVDKFFALTQNETHYLNSKPVAGQEATFNLMKIEPWDEYDLSNWNSLVRKAKSKGKSLDEDNSYARVSMPRFKKDKNNPNFLNVYIDYDLGPGGASIAFGKETMTGQIRRLSAAKAMRLAGDVARDLEAEYDLEDIDIQDLKNGKVRIFAVSDDFINMDPNMLGEATEEEENEFHKNLDKLVHKTFGHSSDEKKKSIAQELAETIKLGEGVIEEELCPKGKAYIKRRKAAGEKSSAYLSGRAVKVCKGQMSGRKKKK
jgi:uncharacterized protein YodC (DUF2158 family)